MNKLIPELKEFPSKTELQKITKEYLNNTRQTIFEKFLTLKFLENLCKIAFANFNKQDVIKSALEHSGGAMNFDYQGINVKITKENINKTFKKYQFTDKTTKLIVDNERKINELKTKIKLLETEIKQWQTHEINSNLAVEIQEALTGETSEPEYGITITLNK